MTEFLYRYRYEKRSVGGIDVSGDYEHIYYKIDFICEKFSIVKYTRCGVWIKLDYYPYKDKFVNLNAKKKYACLTKKEAIESFIKRKNRQIEIPTDQLYHAKKALDMANTKLREIV